MKAFKIALMLTASLVLFFEILMISHSPVQAEEFDLEQMNLLNGDFEEVLQNNVIPGWDRVPVNPAAGTAVEIVEDPVFSGNHSLLIDDQSTSASIGLTSHYVTIEPGETYRMTSEVFVASKSVRGYIKFFDQNGREVGSATELANTEGQWRTLTIDGAAPETATRAKIWFYMGAGGTSKAYVDNVKLYKKIVQPVVPVTEKFEAPVDHGEAVQIPLSQGAAYGVNNGVNEQYIVVTGSPAVFYAVNAETGEHLFSQEMPGLDVAWTVEVASDGNVYFAGTTNGVVYRYLPAEKRIENLGVNPSDKFIWDLEPSSDGKIYGATYPNSKVFEYDIATGEYTDLGPMKEGQQYARGLGVSNQYVYTGIGTDAALIRYERKTGEKTELEIPVSGQKTTIGEIEVYSGKLFVHNGSKMYVMDEETGEHLKTIDFQTKMSPPSPYNPVLIYYKNGDELFTYNMAENTTAKVENIPPVPGDTSVKAHAWITLNEGENAGQTVLAGMAAFTDSFFYNPTNDWYELHFPEVEARGVAINALSAIDGKVYAGGYQRGVSVFDQKSKEYVYSNKAFHQSEGIHEYNGNIYFGTYPGAKMYRYDPNKPFDYQENGLGNPGLFLDIEDEQDRPFAMTTGDNQLFIGTIPGYGKLGGAITVVSEEENKKGEMVIESQTYRNIVKDQSIFGLAYKDGKLFGGTSITGGLGINPAADEAKMFVFDVETGQVIKEFTPEIPGYTNKMQMIGDLSFGPDGLLWGIIDGIIFAMDPETFEVVKSKIVYETAFNSSKFRPFYLQWGNDGLLYTTLNRKLTVVDPQTLNTQQLVDGTVNLMSLGTNGSIYYAMGSKLFELPIKQPDEIELYAPQKRAKVNEELSFYIKAKNRDELSIRLGNLPFENEYFSIVDFEQGLAKKSGRDIVVQLPESEEKIKIIGSSKGNDWTEETVYKVNIKAKRHIPATRVVLEKYLELDKEKFSLHYYQH
ncbi:PQQ-binding-like beta-propeller repeat protein [Jeotgalibacillus soli]|uniref:CBM-cenC domain-containing protein n=1 Tax=Jeotgalibacillus soli TaxID=889306 RepID=A0A0C2S753_9BACL|nr:PQQ-binding-like beta-propeller repeat protein [Jeotgalibacillus soli]KIL49859.1 hypothetical protein KP78_13270 [Jeotgalibacillus soli]